MRTLVIETTTMACSVALIDGDEIIDAGDRRVDRGHAEYLLPMIATLAGGGRADRILVDVGPGSFTGIRVGVAAARALAFAWGIPVHGFASLALIAAMDAASGEKIVAIEGGHGEAFVARYGGDPLVEVEAPRSIPYAELGDVRPGRAIGNAAGRLKASGNTIDAPDWIPSARDVVRLPPGLVALPPTPLYGRGADARPMTPRLMMA